MTDRVRAGVNAMQLALGKASLDRSPPYAEGQELLPPHHPVLTPRQLTNRSISGMQRPFSLNGMGNSPFIGHAHDDDWRRRTGGALRVAEVRRK